MELLGLPLIDALLLECPPSLAECNVFSEVATSLNEQLIC